MKGLIFKIFSVLAGIGAIFFFGSNSGRRKEQNKQNKRKIETYDEANKTRKEVKNIPIDKLDDELDSLLND